MSSYIHFIRHGITDGIKNKLFYGWADLPVIEEGFAELEEHKAAGIYPAVDMEDTLFFTSGMIRANQTLEVIYGDVPFKPVPDMKEINFGEWELKHYSELQSQPQWDNWMNDTDGSFAFPGGDSIISFYARVQKGVTEIVNSHRMKELSHRHNGKDTETVVVCHGGVISAAMIHWFPDDREGFWNWTPKTGRGYTVEFKDGEPAGYTEI